MALHRLSGRALAPVAGALLALSLAGCSTPANTAASVYKNEKFGSEETFSQPFDTDAETACKAARLALLSQGYVVASATQDVVTGHKRFQPGGDVHVRINFTITCAHEPGAPARSTVFVNAVQDRYALKKSTSSASVGLPLASLSIPVTASDDSLVLVGSETIPAGGFYERFFSLIQRYAEGLGCEGKAAEGCAGAGGASN